MSSFRRTAAVAVLAGASLLLTGCGSSGESNSRKVIEHLLVDDKDAAQELMTADRQDRIDHLTAREAIGGGDSRFVPECELGDSETETDEEGRTVHVMQMDCPEGSFTMQVAVTDDNLVDDIDYRSIKS